MPYDYSEIFFIDSSFLKAALQFFGGLLVFGNDQKTRSVLVDTMDESGHRSLALVSRLQNSEKSVAFEDVFSLVDRESGWLVKNYQLRILEDGLGRRDAFCRCF